MIRAYISIGSNINREKNISTAISALKHHFGDLILSSIYETEPVGFSGDPFYNLVAGFESNLTAKEVGKLLKKIETEHGRIRTSEKFSARSLDLDFLLYGDLITSEGRLQLPRDEITRYAFVLEPLAEIAPDLRHPVSHEKYQDLWEKYDKTDQHQKKLR